MKPALFVALAAGLVLVGCGGDEGEDPSKAPKVEYKTMEDIGKLPPEQEAKKLREQDQRPQEDKAEGGI